MRHLLGFAVGALALLAATAPEASAVPDGGYIAIGIGGAIASGDRGVELDSPTAQAAQLGCPTCYDETVRTDFGSGLAFELRFGYLIAGILAPEISLGGHGETSFDSGAAYPSFVLRYHPVEHAIAHEDRAWDANVYVGVGYAIGGYYPDEKKALIDDGKGWDGVAVLAGVGFDYQVASSVSLGLDVRFALPQYGTFRYDDDKDLDFDPKSTPSTLVIIPTLQAIFHI
ncbi:MAG: hypothetical protein KC635_22525 [Myxococcales bacterium]|nr:hypothetical protein [Myxococcales bacterium]MCB9731557.1 hypothetical protein [Deltaproteobacteria bacterium]